MDKLEIRMTREQLDTCIDALALAAVRSAGSELAADCEQLGSWMSHRYTVRWGLPRSAREALDRARGNGG